MWVTGKVHHTYFIVIIMQVTDKYINPSHNEDRLTSHVAKEVISNTLISNALGKTIL